MTCSTSLSLPYAFQQHMQIMQILFASALHYITGENKLLAHAPADRNKYAWKVIIKTGKVHSSIFSKRV